MPVGKLTVLGKQTNYFDALQFREACETRYGKVSVRKYAPELGVSHEFLRQLQRGMRAPSLDTYCRIVARMDMPFGAFVRGISDQQD